ncbi:MAG: heavy metal translocating P-type ATPase, partial [Clostridia bacterium]|nr:heavy metal translocating P-type ATPase [Clostridia bacterium]
MRLNYEIKGMTCAACVSHVERAVSRVLDEKDSFSVSLLTNSVSLIVDDGADVKGLESRLAAAIKSAGYELVTQKETNKKEQSESRKRIVDLVISVIFTLGVMALSMGHMIGIPTPAFLSGTENAAWMCLAQFLLTLPVLIINRRFFVSGARALWNRSPNMDSLICVGAGASILYGLFAFVMIITAKNADVVHKYLHDLYFESAAMILTLVSLGKLLEARVKDKTADAIRSLSTLAPAFVTVLREEKECVIPIEELKKEDVFLIRAGERIPADGIVLSGSGTVDESALTGESMPVEKSEGGEVRAACILLSGALTVRAERVGEDSSLARIIRLLEDAASSKAPIARVADKVSAVFVPIVMAISALTLIVWLIATKSGEQALRSAISVLVISCPCALGLATPTAITVGVGRAAKVGVLFRSAEALEKLCSAATIVFDKTGTLTEGKPALTDVYTYNTPPEELLLAAASVEHLSSHPLAAAVCKGAEDFGITHFETVTDFETLTGVGALGTVGGKVCRIGRPSEDVLAQIDNAPKFTQTQENTAFSLHVVQKDGVGDIKEDISLLENQGKTVVLVTLDGTPVGVLALADRIREDAKDAIQNLKKANIKCLMLTGDNERTAAAISAQAGLDGYRAGLMPEDKERIVREISGTSVCAMVGDGINDAPALTRADIGIAIGAGTEVAIDCADVVLSGNTLSGVDEALRISRATLRIIKQNLFWALFYNAICIPVAAGALYPITGWQLSPMLASAAMSCSSLFVVSNALRLRFISLYKGEKKMFGLKKKETVTHTLTVEGMMCKNCVAHVQKALEGVKGVTNVAVDLESKTATVDALSSVSVDTLIAAVTAAGYGAAVHGQKTAAASS